MKLGKKPTRTLICNVISDDASMNKLLLQNTFFLLLLSKPSIILQLSLYDLEISQFYSID